MLKNVSLKILTILKRYLLPGLVFQSLVIAGGYGTGRELVEFFLGYGPLGGLLSMVLVSTVIWSLVCAVSFELARSLNAYDYRSFSRGLLGRAWGLYEVLYLGMMLLVLAVVAATAGSIVKETFQLPYWLGVVGMMAVIGFLVFKGSTTIEGFFSVWSFVLYAAYAILCLWSFVRFESGIISALWTLDLQPGWYRGGIAYAAYNVGLVPSVLFAVRHIEKRREAVLAGLLAGPIGMIPGVMFYLAAVSHFPSILHVTVPVDYLLGVLGSRVFQIMFQVVLLGTLIESGTGLIHAFNERISGRLKEEGSVLRGSIRFVNGFNRLPVPE
ncbi:MAG: YkvI family membrane protein [bacterium]